MRRWRPTANRGRRHVLLSLRCDARATARCPDLQRRGFRLAQDPPHRGEFADWLRRTCCRTHRLQTHRARRCARERKDWLRGRQRDICQALDASVCALPLGLCPKRRVWQASSRSRPRLRLPAEPLFRCVKSALLRAYPSSRCVLRSEENRSPDLRRRSEPQYYGHVPRSRLARVATVHRMQRAVAIPPGRPRLPFH